MNHLTRSILARKKKSSPAPDPEIFEKRRESLRRKHRQVIYLNDSEMAAIEEYCSRFKVHAKATLFREAILSKVLSELEENHPTLF